MANNVRRQNLFTVDNTPLATMLTLLGLEYEAEWIDEAVDTDGTVYAVLTAPADKYLVLNTREVQTDQERGFYMFYTDDNYSGGTEVDSLAVVPMRGDTNVTTGATMATVTSPTVTGPPSITLPLFGAEGQGNTATVGDLSADSAVRVLAPGGSYLLAFTNDSADASYWRLALKWHEVSSTAMPVSEDI